MRPRSARRLRGRTPSMPAGLNSTIRRPAASPAFPPACTTPRGMWIDSPARSSRRSPPTSIANSPATTWIVSSASRCRWGGSDQPAGGSSTSRQKAPPVPAPSSWISVRTPPGIHTTSMRPTFPYDLRVSVVKINAITVPRERFAEFEERFAPRAGKVEAAARASRRFELLRPNDDREVCLVVTRWRSRRTSRPGSGPRLRRRPRPAPRTGRSARRASCGRSTCWSAWTTRRLRSPGAA